MKPDLVIGQNYLLRWYLLPKNDYFNVYLHCFGRSDDDRALHDHPWNSLSIILKGSYIEHFEDKKLIRKAGQVFGRKARTAHRIELVTPTVWTLFITTRKIREWGFHCPKGWVHWKDFTNFNENGDSTSIGRGCD